MVGVVILGHEDRAGSRLRVVEWIRAHPSCECWAVLVAETPLEELRRFFPTVQLRGEPTVEGIAVVYPLLSCQSGKAFSCNSEPTRLGVTFCAPSGPLRCLVSAPGSSHGDQSENKCLDDFNQLKTGLRWISALAHLV